MTDRELMQQALEALKLIDDAMPFPVAKLAMKNLRERLAQPEQKPVSGVVLDEHGSAALVNNGAEEWHCKKHNARRLYTTPPQRKPLSEEEIQTYRHMIDWTAEWSYINFARAIEAAHGIKGEA